MVANYKNIKERGHRHALEVRERDRKIEIERERETQASRLSRRADILLRRFNRSSFNLVLFNY